MEEQKTLIFVYKHHWWLPTYLNVEGFWGLETQSFLTWHNHQLLKFHVKIKNLVIEFTATESSKVQEQFFRKLNALSAYIPIGKILQMEVGTSPIMKWWVSKKLCLKTIIFQRSVVWQIDNFHSCIKLKSDRCR